MQKAETGDQSPQQLCRVLFGNKQNSCVEACLASCSLRGEFAAKQLNKVLFDKQRSGCLFIGVSKMFAKQLERLRRALFWCLSTKQKG
jgi:hypothetical protein